MEEPVRGNSRHLGGCLHFRWPLARWVPAKGDGLTTEGLEPLLVSTAAFGLHEPILSRLSRIIADLNQDGDLDDLLAAVNAVKAKQRYSLQKPLFAHDIPPSTTSAPIAVRLNHTAIASALGTDNVHLQKALARLEKALGGADEETQVERSVREL